MSLTTYAIDILAMVGFCAVLGAIWCALDRRIMRRAERRAKQERLLRPYGGRPFDGEAK